MTDKPPESRRIFRSRVKPRNRSTKFVKLRGLQCFKEVEARVRSGWSLSRIADFIQQDRGEYIDVSREGLIKQLTEYRNTLGKSELLKTRMPDKMEQLAEEAEEALDEVKELKRLYELQMERVNIDVKSERNIKKLFKTTGQEVFYATKILQVSAAIKMDYGLVKREPTEINVNAQLLSVDLATKYGSEVVEQVITDPNRRRKVLSFVEHLAKREAERRTKNMEAGLDPDGPVIDLKTE